MAENHAAKRSCKSPSNLLTVRAAAELLNVSVSLVYLLVDTRKLTSHRIGAGRGTIRIFKHDLDDFLATCRSAPLASPLSEAPKGGEGEVIP